MKRLIFILLLLALTVGFGVELVGLKVVNRLDKYIHARVGDSWVLFIPPRGESRTLHVPAGENLDCLAIIAPGQEDEGLLIDTTLILEEGRPTSVACELMPAENEWVVDSTAMRR